MDPVVEHSRDMIDRGSKSFGAASRLFDPTTRESAYMLYAWCRYCDDQIDDQMLGHRRGEASGESVAERLDALYRETRSAIAGEPVENPVFQAFQRVVMRHGIPERYPLELLEGFAMDVEEREYRHLDDTLLYSYHVAGVVGVMMAQVMGAQGTETLNRAADLGIALQLTNISRDVVEDAGAGRVYLPADWLAEAGVPVDSVADPACRDGVFAVTHRLLGEAERYYESANHGLPDLGFRSAWAVATARGVYRDIGALVARRGPRAWDRRAVVSRPRKLYRGLRAALEAFAAVTFGKARTHHPREGLWTKT